MRFLEMEMFHDRSRRYFSLFGSECLKKEGRKEASIGAVVPLAADRQMKPALFR